jgi:hypothetical protein
MVNGGGRSVFVERRGALEAVPDRTLDTRNLTVAIKNIARACGNEISEAQPMLDARLGTAHAWRPCSRPARSQVRADDSQVHPPLHAGDLVGLARDTGAYRRPHRRDRDAVQHPGVGGTGTGKTTLLNAIAARFDTTASW